MVKNLNHHPLTCSRPQAGSRDHPLFPQSRSLPFLALAGARFRCGCGVCAAAEGALPRGRAAGGLLPPRPRLGLPSSSPPRFLASAVRRLSRLPLCARRQRPAPGEGRVWGRSVGAVVRCAAAAAAALPRPWGRRLAPSSLNFLLVNGLKNVLVSQCCSVWGLFSPRKITYLERFPRSSALGGVPFCEGFPCRASRARSGGGSLFRSRYRVQN